MLRSVQPGPPATRAWIVFFLLATLLMLSAFDSIRAGGPPDASQFGEGMTWKQVIAERPWKEVMASRPGIMPLIGLGNIARGLGIVLLGFSFFGMAIAIFAYRRGEKWAWYVSWYWPLLFISIVTNHVMEGGDIRPTLVVLAVIALLGLLLPYRKFFPKRSSEDAMAAKGGAV